MAENKLEPGTDCNAQNLELIANQSQSIDLEAGIDCTAPNRKHEKQKQIRKKKARNIMFLHIYKVFLFDHAANVKKTYKTLQ